MVTRGGGTSKQGASFFGQVNWRWVNQLHNWGEQVIARELCWLVYSVVSSRKEVFW
jgi:hypothetical protein